MELILENIRTFAGRHEISIKPLTIITGENSSGKTTLLGMFSALFDVHYPLQPNFNAAPYNFGNYDTIATYVGGRAGRSRHFCLGYHSEEPPVLGQGKPIETDAPKRIEAKYVDRHGQVRLANFRAQGDGFDFTLEVGESRGRELQGKARIRVGDKNAEFDISESQRSEISAFELNPLMQLFLGAWTHDPKDPESVKRSRIIAEGFNRLMAMTRSSQGQVLSVAPIRTKPERTYSQITETFKPTGDHIPFLLDQVLREDSVEQKRLVEALNAFGAESHLFEKFKVRHLGRKKVADAFELMVTVAGKTVNLVDVGYGVSQCLPVVVQSALRPSGQMLLLQQPEVHLHPRAQAALGSLFARLAALDKGYLLVETHSDYIIDRVRQEVAKGQLSAEKVGLLYLHRKGGITIPHEIGIDDKGNLTQVPPNYREFFLQEELNLFNRGHV